MFPSQWFISLLLPLFSLFINFSGADNSFFANNCPSSFCNGVEVKYPFWRIDNHNSSFPRYCGYPGFGINCSDHTNPILYLPHDYFLVKIIDYTNRNLTLVDMEVLHNLSCPIARYNLTLEFPWGYSNLDKDLIFYYNCTRHLPSATSVDCLTCGGKRSYVYVEHDEPEDLYWHGICEDRMVATVVDREWTLGFFGDRGVATAIGEGFVLDWKTVAECGKCEASQGFCGFDNSTQEKLCFCKDGTTNFDHCNTKATTPSVSIYVTHFPF